MEPGERPHEPNRPGKLRLWYGFAAAPTAWAMQGVIAVMVSAELCPNNLPNWSLMGENGVRLLLGLITLGLFAVAISAGILALQNWQALTGNDHLLHAEGSARMAFMSLGGVLISSVFAVGLLWSGIPLMMLQECMRAR